MDIQKKKNREKNFSFRRFWTTGCCSGWQRWTKKRGMEKAANAFLLAWAFFHSSFSSEEGLKQQVFPPRSRRHSCAQDDSVGQKRGMEKAANAFLLAWAFFHSSFDEVRVSVADPSTRFARSGWQDASPVGQDDMTLAVKINKKSLLQDHAAGIHCFICNPDYLCAP